MAATRADLAAEVEALQARLEEARREVEKVQNQYTEHLQRVGRTAMQYAEDHDMCEVVEEAMEAADVPFPTTEVTIEIYYPITVTVRGGISEDELRNTLPGDVMINMDPDYSLSGVRYRDATPAYLNQHGQIRIVEVREQ